MLYKITYKYKYEPEGKPLAAGTMVYEFDAYDAIQAEQFASHEFFGEFPEGPVTSLEVRVDCISPEG